MKATGIVRRIDDLGRVVIPKEIRRTMRIREGEPLLTTLTPFDRFCWAIHSVVERYYKQQNGAEILLRFVDVLLIFIKIRFKSNYTMTMIANKNFFV